MAGLAAPYVPRAPQETLLYALVSEHLEDFLQHARESYAGPLPRYVEEGSRGYLRCGDFGRGLVYVRCTTCGDGMAVAFSCKLRGLCPSCSGRRMAGSAAHLVDGVLPAVPTRQHVVAFPDELSVSCKDGVPNYLVRSRGETLKVVLAKSSGTSRAEASTRSSGSKTKKTTTTTTKSTRGQKQ